MKFSILMPLFNMKKYVSVAIDSILGQNFDDWELIIVDDGSTDGSEKIVDEYANRDTRIKVIHKPNGGLISARRTAISQAQGDYCLFCDSDDYYMEDALSNINNVINRFKSPDIVLFGCNRTRDNGQFLDVRFPWSDCAEISVQEARYTLITTWYINSLCTKAIKTFLLKSDPTDYSISYSGGYAEDKLQSLYPFDACSSVVALPMALYAYRINSESMMQKKITIEEIKNFLHIDVQEIIYRYIKKWNIPNLENDYFALGYSNVGETYKHMILSAGSLKEIKEIHAFNWSSCLLQESKENFNKHLLTKRTRILSRMALRPTLIGAYALRLVFYTKRKR